MEIRHVIIYVIIGILIIIAGIAFIFQLKIWPKAKPIESINPDTLAGVQTGNYPWQPETNNLKSRLNSLGLPALAQESNTLHTHQHLDIFINGRQVSVPMGIGINDSQKFISPIHTHDATGIIHVESPIVQKYYLGQFFDIWGVKLNQSCIGGYCVSGDNSLKIFINGSKFDGNPAAIELQPHQEIVIAYGTISQMPFPVPSSYAFPKDY